MNHDEITQMGDMTYVFSNRFGSDESDGFSALMALYAYVKQ